MKQLVFFLTFTLIVAAAWCTEKEWNGKWEFTECWPDTSGEVHDCITYTLDIQSAGTEYKIDVNAVGFQTMKHIEAVGHAKKDELEVAFVKTVEDLYSGKREVGERLLTLRKVKGKIVTEWGTLIPTLEENLKPGIYFAKQK